MAEPKLWEIRPADLAGYYTVSRAVNRRRVHLEYASDGKPMWYGAEQANAAASKANAGVNVGQEAEQKGGA